MKIGSINISGITSDSKKVKEGYGFVAIKGEHHDGNEFIDEAISRGAKIIFTENDIDSKAIPVIKVDNARIKLAELLNEFYDYPSEKIHLIGVTGTNGKTTTTHIIESIFKEAGYKTGLIGTLGIKNNNSNYKRPNLTTPESEVLFETLHAMVNEGIEVVVMEVSSHGLKFQRVYGLEFDIAVHTNIEKDHMNLHKTIEDYIQSKKMLFDSLGRNKIAVINIDDEQGIKLLEGNNKALVVTYGLNKKATVTASSLDISNRIGFNLCLQRSIATIHGKVVEPLEFVVSLNLMGKHNVYNSLAAIVVSLMFEIDIEVIKRALNNFKGIHRRLEKIFENSFLAIDDFSHNPASYDAVFETIQTLAYNKLILVNAIRGNRGIDVNQENAEVICSWNSILRFNNIILSLSKDVTDEKDEVTKEELIAYKEVFNKEKVKYSVIDTLEDSMHEAVKQLKDGDIVLMLGAQGMDKGRDMLFKVLEKEEASLIN